MAQTLNALAWSLMLLALTANNYGPMTWAEWACIGFTAINAVWAIDDWWHRNPNGRI